MTTDRISLRGLRVHGHHGVLPHERRGGQVFVIDATLYVDLSRAAASDDLADTVDYASLAHALSEVVEGEPVDLIETLAHRLAQVCLGVPRVERVELTVHKPEAPVGLPVEDVAVSVTRSRE